MRKLIEHIFDYGGLRFVLQAGEIGNQADAAVRLQVGDSVLLATVTARKAPEPPPDFLPLTVDYFEKYYSNGRIPRAAARREGPMNQRESLIARTVDRAIRPTFDPLCRQEVHVVVQLLSLEPGNDVELAALLVASAALRISGLPLTGVTGAARVAFAGKGFVLNPPPLVLAEASIDILAAGVDRSLLMANASAAEALEDVMVDALAYAHIQMQHAITEIEYFSQQANGSLPMLIHVDNAQDESFDALEAVQRGVLELAKESDAIKEAYDVLQATMSLLETRIIRSRAVAGQPRSDGRSNRDIRRSSMRVGLLPGAHGSALFTQGDGQTLAVVTLGGSKDSQIIDTPGQRCKSSVMIQTSVPPFATGDTGRLRFTSRREIEHGAMMMQAFASVLPSDDKFSYVTRVVMEVLEADGTIPMSTTCATSLALCDAGVPIRGSVAALAMGAVRQSDRWAVLTDTTAREEQALDSLLRVAGTESGITAMRMDIKPCGVSFDTLHSILSQAREGRLELLARMTKLASSEATSETDSGSL